MFTQTTPQLHPYTQYTVGKAPPPYSRTPRGMAHYALARTHQKHPQGFSAAHITIAIQAFSNGNLTALHYPAAYSQWLLANGYIKPMAKRGLAALY